jgi:hypothetical protein
LLHVIWDVRGFRRFAGMAIHTGAVMPLAPSEDTILKLYLSLSDAERAFNTIQNAYRRLASTWTLACLGGIGFVLTKPDATGLENYLACGLIALSAAVSIFVLWLVDIRVYQELLAQYFNEMRAMERGERWLPQVRNQTRRAFKGRIPRRISLFYALLIGFLWVVACVFFALSKVAVARHNIGPLLSVVMAPIGAGSIFAILWLARPARIVDPDDPIEKLQTLAQRTAAYEEMAAQRAADDEKRAKAPVPPG